VKPGTYTTVVYATDEKGKLHRYNLGNFEWPPENVLIVSATCELEVQNGKQEDPK
jgi:hypothetical protein